MLRWQPTSRDAGLWKRRRRGLALSALGVALLSLSYRANIPVLVYNPSESAPVGYYLARSPTLLKRGDWALVTPPIATRRYAAERGYLPATVPMIKRVAALDGDQICALNDRIFVNGVYLAARLHRDRNGRTLSGWTGCRVLTEGEVFVLNTHAAGSFDGRYFGVVSREAVRARLLKL